MARSCTRLAGQAAVLLFVSALLLACPIPSTPPAATWTLTANATGSGTVSCSPDLTKYPDGTPVTLTALPDTDWAFLGWSGDASGRENPLTLQMTENRSLTASFYRLADRGPTVASCMLGGTPHAGENWTARWAAADCTHVVAEGETLADIAASLALLLDALADTCAASEGTTFAAVDISGAPIDLVLSVGSAGSALIDAAAPRTKLVTLSATPVVGETWTVAVDGTSVSHTIQPLETLSDIVADLAAQIDALGGYFATSEGSTIAASRASGEDFSIATTGCSAAVDDSTSTTRSVLLTGPYYPDETWSVELAGVSAACTPAPGDIGPDIAQTLAAALGAVPGFEVGSEGSLVIVVKPSGGAFALSSSVTPTGTGAIDDAVPTAVLLTPDGDVVAGETWTLSLDGADYEHLVQAGDTAATLAAALASEVNGSTGTVASSEDRTVAIASLGGEPLSAALEVTVP